MLQIVRDKHNNIEVEKVYTDVNFNTAHVADIDDSLHIFLELILYILRVKCWRRLITRISSKISFRRTLKNGVVQINIMQPGVD
jgi:hypothetical protein